MAEQVQDNTKVTSIRLPDDVKPSHYDLSVRPDFKKFTFGGSVKIHYTSTRASLNDVVLHANVLKIHEGSAESTDKSHVATLKRVTYGSDTETAVLTFDGPISGSGVISLKFSGVLDDKMKGFYRTSFKVQDPTGQDRNVIAASSQFESVDARRCLPCFDEPAFKATFTVEIVYEKFTEFEGTDFRLANVALSNMPVVSQTELSDGLVSSKFDKSPIMSTYLLCLVVGPFEFIEKSDGRRPVRVYTTPGKTDQGKFALEVVAKSLKFYEDYFDVAYPLPKMDMIAIPDFAMGAMENWGLVTYRETCILVDPKNTATRVKQNVALVVAHEIAHQWFGNLVTMQWWTHLWLNEGFATFMEYLCVDHIFPEFDIWSQFVTDAHGSALFLDALKNSHPIEVPVNHPSEVEEIFDQISYEKGASIIRMLYSYIGDDCFRRGMHDYLNKFNYNNASTEDLWDALGKASNKPIRQIMSGWTSQKGFPYIRVSCEPDGDCTKLVLQQEKFNADGVLEPDEVSTRWMCPIDVVLESEPNKTCQLGLLDAKEGVMKVPAKDGWIKLNSGCINFYHSAYTSEMLMKFRSAVESQSLGAMDRLDLQEGSFALCRAGKTGTVDYLKLVEAFAKESHHSVLSSIDSCLGYLNNILSQTDFVDKFHAYGRALYSNMFRRFGWDAQPGESHTDAMTRPVLLNRLITFKDQATIEEALKRFEAGDIPADIRGAVYKAVATYGDDAAFEKMFKMYETATLQEEQMRLIRCMALTLNEDRLKKMSEYVFTDNVRNQDKAFVIICIGMANAQVGWDLLTSKRETLISIYGTNSVLSRLVKSIASNFVSEQKAAEIESYFEKNEFPGAERSIKQAIETVRMNARWLERDRDAIKEYLAQKN